MDVDVKPLVADQRQVVALILVSAAVAVTMELSLLLLLLMMMSRLLPSVLRQERGSSDWLQTDQVEEGSSNLQKEEEAEWLACLCL